MLTTIMDWIYLSPHPDDVAISCGGLVWEQTNSGIPVSIWTICAGDPPSGLLSPFAADIQNRWQIGNSASLQRRQEDQASCAILGAGYHHFSTPDCIYRRSLDGSALYVDEDALFGNLHPAEVGLVQELSRWLTQSLPENAQVVCPLAIGGHVDHRLTRLAAEGIDRPLWYYADYPYTAQDAHAIQALIVAGWHAKPYLVGPAGQAAWQQAVAAHRSQISTFWKDEQALQQDLTAYRDAMLGGVRLWRTPAAAAL